MKITLSPPTKPTTAEPVAGIVAIAITEGGGLSDTTAAIDKSYKGIIGKAIKDKKFSGKKNETLTLSVGKVGKTLLAEKIILFGCGKGNRDNDFYRGMGATLYKIANADKVAELHIFAEAISQTPEQACLIAYGCEFYAYEFKKYITDSAKKNKNTIKKIRVYGEGAAQKFYRPYQARLKGAAFARDLVSEPPNELYPETFAAACKTLTNDGIKVTVLGETQMQKLGMRTLLGVGQGSHRQSQAVIMEWRGDKNKTAAPYAFIGKGVTFDTGGISLKPAPGMEEMKWDMAGAAAVSGLMKTLALRRAPVNAVGIIGLVENMPDGNAQRPGDIVKSYSGKTVEIHNTDAEGRLVLADILSYCEEKFKPKSMIDLATLTGAIIIALGHEYAGLFSNDDALAESLQSAGIASGEKLWRLPLHAAYDKLLNTTHADMKNIGGRSAGSITAAQFLQRFVRRTAWAHLDIAGVAWWNKPHATGRTGASGYGVALLDEWVAGCEAQ